MTRLQQLLRLSAVTVPVIGLFAVSLVHAQQKTMAPVQAPNVKAGSWQVTSSTQMSGAPDLSSMGVDTSKLTPEMKAQMAAVMASSAANVKQSVDTYCVTKKDLSQPLFKLQQNDENCDYTVVKSTASVQDVKFSCNGSMPSTGQMHVDVLSTESVKGTFDMSMGAGDHPMTMKSTFTAKWMGDTCQ